MAGFQYRCPISEHLRTRFEASDYYKAVTANLSTHPTLSEYEHCSVEHARIENGNLEVWVFWYPSGCALPCEHNHLMVRPDQSEHVVIIKFQHAGDSRLKTKESPHGPTSPN